MSNIERLLDNMLKFGGEKLVIGLNEPIYVLRTGEKTPLLQKVLSSNEFNFIEAEYAKIFESSPEFSYKGQTIQTRREGSLREFYIAETMTPPPPPPKVDVSSMPGSPLPSQDQPPPTPAPQHPPVPQPPPVPAAPVSTSGSWDMDTLLRLLVERKGSDLHLSTGCKPSMRIDGDMAAVEEYPELTEEDLLRELNKISPQRNIDEFAKINDTDFAYSIEGLARFRANAFRDIRGVGAVFRVIPSKILSVDDLSVPKAMVELCKIPKGLILVTGPTGSGKSTTLAALINHINETQRKHIITIEDPVEFVHPNKLSLVNQREIGAHTQSFKRALKAALREDPDIILVGEMRDLETIAIAIEMAVTGHLVFGTLHTSTAIATVDRIIDQFPADQQSQIRAMLSDALIGVCAQTLLKKKGGGRVGAFEILVVTPAVTNLIREGKNYQIATLMQTGKGIGMQMINSHLSELVEKGAVEAEEAIEKAIDKENLKTTLKGKGLYQETS